MPPSSARALLVASFVGSSPSHSFVVSRPSVTIPIAWHRKLRRSSSSSSLLAHCWPARAATSSSEPDSTDPPSAGLRSIGLRRDASVRGNRGARGAFLRPRDIAVMPHARCATSVLCCASLAARQVATSLPLLHTHMNLRADCPSGRPPIHLHRQPRRLSPINVAPAHGGIAGGTIKRQAALFGGGESRAGSSQAPRG